MKRAKLILSVLSVASLFALAPAFAQENQQQLVRSRVIFDGRTQMRDAKAENAVRDTQIRIQNIAIVGGQKLQSLGLRSNGITIMQLRAGDLTTIINGNRQERHEGEFWTVPAGAQFSIETEDDTASVQTIEIVRP
jgi:hypothetical protein